MKSRSGARDRTDPSWRRGRLTPEHPLEVYRVPVSYYVERIRREHWFSYTKINHGFWEYERILRDLPPDLGEDERRRIDARHGRRFCFEGGFRDELIDLLRALSPQDPDFHLATSHVGYPGSDRIEGVTADPAGLLSVVAETLPQGFVPHDGMLWKAATISGEIRSLYDAIRPHRVLAVGPPWLETLRDGLGLRGLECVEIHPREARRERDAILDRIREAHARRADEPLIVLFQAASLAAWLVGHLHGELANTCLIDLGRSLDVCNPRSIFRHGWGRVYRRALAENMGAVDARVKDPRPFFSDAKLEPWQRSFHHYRPRRTRARPIPFAEPRPQTPSNAGAAPGSGGRPGARERLEHGLAAYLDVPAERRVVLCANARVGLGALVELARPVPRARWCAPAFADPRVIAPPFAPTRRVDCDLRGMMSERDLALGIDRVDGVVVANPFGLAASLEPIEQLCRRRGKALVCDGSWALDAPYRSTSTTHEVVSLAEDRAWGHGEAAFVLVDAAEEREIRHLLAADGAVSEDACAAILARLQDFQDYAVRYHLQYARIVRFARELGFTPLGPEKTLEKLATPSSVPLVAPWTVARSGLTAHPTLQVRKLYAAQSPGLPVAHSLAARLVNVPCHPGLESSSNDELRRALEALLPVTRTQSVRPQRPTAPPPGPPIGRP